ncbi:MAG TPA: hypothetical protein VN605_09740, partial [Thermoanaerobaculia bacterium]|nr:hypothetical protein [Thermoanaerobaculia bacterium]
LPPVPADSRFRAALRVYALAPDATGALVPAKGVAGGVSIFAIDNPSFPIAQARLHFDDPVPAGADGLPPVAPSFAILDLVAAFPQLANTGEYIVKLQPHGYAAAGVTQTYLWGFISVTNNDTQQVTMVAPR